jgi:prevent-host-death family protein
MKQVSIAEAKNTLPALIHEAESAPIEIQRRGKPVAVLVSRATYDRLKGKKSDPWAAIERWREKHRDSLLTEHEDPWANVRSKDSTGGRPPIKW